MEKRTHEGIYLSCENCKIGERNRAAKAGISNFTQWLAVHFAPCNIRCNAIAPGFFVTNQNRSLLFNEDGTPTARTGKILAATPMKKFGEISDLIGTLMWLADDNASGFVTGTVIPVDGGFSAYSVTNITILMNNIPWDSDGTGL